jgi:nucleotide-binding universal stress UspA family protein
LLIAHTTDLSGDDEVAFEHAVALARASGSRLASVHACVGSGPARELPHAGPGIDHQRILHQCCDDATETLLDAMRELGPDLVVAATHARTGLERLLSGSVAEAVARNLSTPVLLLPLDGTRFVEQQSGAIRLERVLAPAGSLIEAQAAVDAAVGLARFAGLTALEIVLLHVGSDPAPQPEVPRPFSLVARRAGGELDTAIVEAADAVGADAIVMPTRGHDGLADVLVGSHTERVLHQCRRPVLWVPLPP